MAKIIKKHWDIALILGIGFVLAISIFVGMGALRPGTNDALAAATSVTVTATVNQWLTFTISTDTASILPALVDTAGVLATGTSNSITLTAGSNHDSGFNITIDSDDGKLNYGVTSTIASHGTGTTTLAVGADYYGIQASSTNMTVDAVYNYWDAKTIGTASTTAPSLAVNAGPEDSQTTGIRFLAATSKTKHAGAYSDMVELTCLAGIP